MEKTYHNRTIFKLECEQCEKPIYPGETLATEYYQKSNGELISVLEAYKLGAQKTFHKWFCGLCKPFIK